MDKTTKWVVVSILLAYFVFTSGYWFWLSDTQITSRIITPFSWALSAERTGLTGVHPQSDLDCVEWLINKSDKTKYICADSNGIFLLSGHLELIPHTWKVVGRQSRMIPPIQITDYYCYIFMTEWNTRQQKYIEPVDVGLRRSLPLSVEGATLNILLMDDNGDTIDYSCVVKEVFRSGESVVYEKVEQ